MLNAKLQKWMVGSVVGLGLGGMLALSACSGDTDGGGAAEDAQGPGDPVVSDGGFGATLKIVLGDESIGVGDTSTYHVELRDPVGNPIPFIRIFCETERGVAIVEPSVNGVAFEHTDFYGNMSGVIGGVLPGSFLMECRAQQGFNLYDRKTVKVTGDVPLGFEGFPGAAGGNLGGGVIVDTTPDVDDGVGLRISSLQFEDAGGPTNVGPLDLTADDDCNNDGTATDAEPFEFTNFQIGITNETTEDVTIQSASFVINDGGSPARTGTINVTTGVAAGGTATVSAPLTSNAASCPATAESIVCYSGTNTLAVEGRHQGILTVVARTAAGDSVSLIRNFSIQWDYVDNCGAGS
jgi:hypothetical protein